MAENEFIRERNEFICERIIEGICPTHATPLERRRDCGWCVECGCGYSLGPEHLTLHTEFTLSDPKKAAPTPKK